MYNQFQHIRVHKPHNVIAKKIMVEKGKDSYESERDTFLKCFVGINKTGKSATMRSIVEAWRAAKPDYYKIAAFDPQHKFEDITDFRLYNWKMEEAVETILGLRNTLLIIDDIREFHPKRIPAEWILHLLSERGSGAWNIDIMIAIHNPSQLLEILANHTSHYYIFYTETLQGTWDKKVSSYVHCKAASLEVNKYVSTFGKGKYPDFPHIIVDNTANDEEKLKAINMRKGY